MSSYVRCQGYSYVSFFDGARAFFGYLPWSSQLQAPTHQSFSSNYSQLVAVNTRQNERLALALTPAGGVFSR